ncbi:glycosyltransferase family 2 protein [Marinoscillum sp.]|uniref:glycosyltransferase family 2 protein n=1 Tax=Marinoscillum sp. TaxID=2024838 RepID=UPI003BA84766
MTVSIIIPTFNRSAQLSELIQALRKQSFNEFEVIFANDGSTDNTTEVLHQYQLEVQDLKIKVVNSENIGRARIRNLAVTHADSDLLIFYDDDVRPNVHSVKQHVLSHSKYDELLIVSGSCNYDSTRFTHLFSEFRQEMEGLWTDGASNLMESKTLRINGGNFSIKRKLFQEIGGFDERLRDKEDFKLSYDAKQYHGARVLNNPESWVFHDDFKNLTEFIERGIESRKEEQKLKQLDSSIEKFDPDRFNITLPKEFKFQIAGIIFRNKIVLHFIEWFLGLKLLPNRIAFKLYDICITVNIQYFK